MDSLIILDDAPTASERGGRRMALLVECLRQPQGMPLGTAFALALARLDPGLAARLHGTDADPFGNDSHLDAFFDAVDHAWGAVG